MVKMLYLCSGRNSPRNEEAQTLVNIFVIKKMWRLSQATTRTHNNSITTNIKLFFAK